MEFEGLEGSSRPPGQHAVQKDNFAVLHETMTDTLDLLASASMACVMVHEGVRELKSIYFSLIVSRFFGVSES